MFAQPNSNQIPSNQAPLDPQWETYSQHFVQYLNRPEFQTKIQEMVSSNKTRLTINIDHLREYNNQLIQPLLKNPTRCIRILEGALMGVINMLGNEDRGGKKKGAGNVMYRQPSHTFAFEGNFGNHYITPRGLNSLTLHCLVAVSGIVTRISLVRPKLVQSVHYCDTTKLGRIKEYYDQYSITAEKTNMGSSNAYPTKDENNNPLTTEYGFCHYKDNQILTLQEMPEKAPTGLMPFSVEVILEADLIDKVKPGDRVQVVGVFKAITTQSTLTNAIFKTVLVATNVHVLQSELDAVVMTPADLRNIKKVAELPNTLEILSASIAPSIYGHPYIKKAIFLMLLGGVERNLESKTHLRGDINILMVGDPSTAKSQLLRRVLNIAPLAINTTGRGSSGVGLTAAVVFDRDSGERHLEAGAMVLADKGIVCIDEFDKMEESDRVAIHEVMEQQTVTIAKAGIHTSLNARCSVIAAANPIYGEYQKELPPTKNIGLPDSLLSRFDFLFIVLDEKNPEVDRRIAQRVTRNHRYMRPDYDEHIGFGDDADAILEPEYIERNENEDLYEKFNNIIHDPSQTQLVTQRFLKKYINYAKKSIQPVLKDEAIDYISGAWTQLRQRDIEYTNSNQPKTMTITIRTLETLIRVSTAHAKMRLSKEVEIKDCEVAMEILSFALFGETPNTNVDDPDNDEGGDNGDDHHGGFGPKRDEIEEEGDKHPPQRGTSNSLKKKVHLDKDSSSQNQGGNHNQRVTRSVKKDYSEEEKLESKDNVQEISYEKSSEKTKKSQDRPATRSSNKLDQQTAKKSEYTSIKMTPSTDRDSRKLTNQFKKVRLNDEDQIEDLLNASIASGMDIPEEAVKFVFREFNNMLVGQSSVTQAELWEKLQNDKSEMTTEVKNCLKRQEIMIRVLEILDERNKLMYEKTTKRVISL